MATLAQNDLGDGIDVMREGVLFGLPMPVTLRPPVAMSDEELIAFSRLNRPYRIERNARGELEIMSPVGHDGGSREQYVSGELYVWAKAHGGRTFSPSTGFTLGDSSVRSPDASWISEDREGSLTASEKRGFAPVCPEFLIEVLSESDSRAKLTAKMEMWIANGALLAWMIDPFAATVGIYRPGVTVEMVLRPDWVEAHAVVPGFRLEMAPLWTEA